MKKTIITIIIVIVVAIIYTKWDKTPAKEKVSKNVFDWKSKEQIFDYKGYKISYHESTEKSKKTLILLHGYPTSSYDWHSLWSALKTDYHLITMDMLGFGFSDKPNNIEYTMALQTDILEALLTHLNLKNVHLIAHDYGDNIVQEILARSIEKKANYSLNIASAVLLNGGLFPKTHKPTTIQSLLGSPIGGLVASFTNQTFFEISFSKVFGPNSRPSKQEFIDHWYIICQQKGYLIANRLSHAAKDRKKNRERWVDALISTNVPILYISGQLDPVTGIETTEKYIELVPKPNIIILPEAGHFPHIEKPKKVANSIKAFLKKLKKL